MTTDDQKRLLWRCSWMANGRAPTLQDVGYWINEGKLQECLDRGVEIHDDRYAEKRLLGWRATGSDTPRYGEYAIPPTPYRDVPTYPDDIKPVEPPSVPAPPAPSVDVNVILARITALEDALKAEYVTFYAALASVDGRTARIEQQLARGFDVKSGGRDYGDIVPK